MQCDHLVGYTTLYSECKISKNKQLVKEILNKKARIIFFNNLATNSGNSVAS